jgi:hypothetical protein
MNRRLLRALVVVVAAASLAGCNSDRDADGKRLTRMLDTVTSVPHQLTVIQGVGGHQAKVTAIVADSYRYAATLSLDGTPSYQEVVDDEALAARVLAPAGFAAMSAQLRGQLYQQMAGVSVVHQNGQELAQSEGPLASGKWVLDSLGAPAAAGFGSVSSQTSDPITNAINIVDKLRLWQQDSRIVTRFNPESLDYKAKEDPFPRPVAGEVRFDLPEQPLPSTSQRSSNGGVKNPPTESNFRKVAIYVKNNRIVRVLVSIDIRFQLTQLHTAYGIKIPTTGTLQQKIDAALAQVNALIVRSSRTPVTLMAMEVDLGYAPVPASQVGLPTQYTAGSLKALVGRGSTGSGTAVAAANANAAPVVAPPPGH